MWESKRVNCNLDEVVMLILTVTLMVLEMLSTVVLVPQVVVLSMKVVLIAELSDVLAGDNLDPLMKPSHRDFQDSVQCVLSCLVHVYHVTLRGTSPFGLPKVRYMFTRENKTTSPSCQGSPCKHTYLHRGS